MHLLRLATRTWKCSRPLYSQYKLLFTTECEVHNAGNTPNVSLPSVTTPQQYLKERQLAESNPSSSVFRGTLYELHCKQVLETHFHCHQLARVGGAYDNGIDIFGSWDLLHYYDPKRTLSIESKSIRGLLLSRLIQHNSDSDDNTLLLATDIKVLVQCKNTLKKLPGAILREISGIYDFHVKSKLLRSLTFIFLVSPLPMTRQAVTLSDGFTFPLIHLQMEPLHVAGGQDPFRFANYEGGHPRRLYCNSRAQTLLKGLDLDAQFRMRFG